MRNISFVLFSTLFNIFVINNNYINISVHQNKSTLNYKIVNNSFKIIYLPLTYYWRENKDSIIMEAIPKADKENREIDFTPNSFLPPDMKRINKGAIWIKHQLLGTPINIPKRKLFFRVYFKDAKQLLNKNKLESSKREFLIFESKNSILIEAKIW